ncbi:MAG: hypothetical protein HOO06_14605 [Bdellovibrionaceae bacterium]|jgi:hypothetical protein|nr:hypothetical protein [Pseudobdellovibrionaceae bacterium]
MYIWKNSELITKKHNQFAPDSYWNLSNEDKNFISNGCGPKAISLLPVPDHLFGTKIKSACSIHDFMYSKTTNHKEQEIADKIFLENMNALIENECTSKLLKMLKKAKAYAYYFAVSLFGGLFSNTSSNISNN